MTMRDQVTLLELLKEYDNEKGCSEKCCGDCRYAVNYADELPRSCPLRISIAMISHKIFNPGEYKKNMPRWEK